MKTFLSSYGRDRSAIKRGPLCERKMATAGRPGFAQAGSRGLPARASLLALLLLLAWLGRGSTARIPQAPPPPPPDSSSGNSSGIETSAAFAVTTTANAITTTPPAQGGSCSDQYAASVQLPGEDFCATTTDRKTCKNIVPNDGLGPYPPAQYEERCSWDMSCGTKTTLSARCVLFCLVPHVTAMIRPRQVVLRRDADVTTSLARSSATIPAILSSCATSASNRPYAHALRPKAGIQSAKPQLQLPSSPP